ncbi:MAG: hypothetical protein IJL06_05785 [Kiritimatiellae bacterium]|nr:hypothetical protein [Kiritimatiellia bacterium]
MNEESASDNVLAPRARHALPVRVSPVAVILGAFRSGGALLRLFLAFALWFFTACVPWVNLGTTVGLVSAAVDVAKGRPVSPIEVFDARHRARIVPFFLTLGFTIALMAGVSLFSWLCAIQCAALFAAAPGTVWDLPSWLRRLVTLIVFVPAPLVVGASVSLALPVYLDTGAKGLEALAESRRLVEGNLVAVLCVELLPAILGAALVLAFEAVGFSVLSLFAAEAVLFVFALALLGNLYGALRANAGD